MSDSLTPTESAIALLAATGLDREAMAGWLHISRSTLNNHLSGIYDKLGIGGSPGLSMTRLAVWTLREIGA